MPNLCADVVDSQNGQLTKEEEWRLALAASAVIGGGLDTASFRFSAMHSHT